MMNREEFFLHWSRLHGDAQVRGIVRWWLVISFRIASLLRRLHITANAMTLIGVVISISLVTTLLGGRSEESLPLLVSLSLLVISLAADGIDGSLALLTGKESRLGAALDAIADRVVEALWAYTFVLIGADFRVVMVAWLIAQTQEYIRARLGGLGISEIGVVTLCERPVRASILAIFMVIAIIYALTESDVIFSVQSGDVITLGATLWLTMQSIALWQLSRFAIRSTIGTR